MSNLSRTLFVSFLLAASVSAKVYESGSTKVDVTVEYTDENGSDVKTVEFLSNAPEKYSKATFSSTYTDGGTFFECEVTFGDETCDGCQPCTTQDELPGFKLDCFNAQPAEDTNNLCTELSDRSIQEVLVDKIFAVDFGFKDNSTSASPGTGVTAGDDNGTSGTAATFGVVASILMSAVAMLW